MQQLVNINTHFLFNIRYYTCKKFHTNQNEQKFKIKCYRSKKTEHQTKKLRDAKIEGINIHRL